MPSNHNTDFDRFKRLAKKRKRKTDLKLMEAYQQMAREAGFEDFEHVKEVWEADEDALDDNPDHQCDMRLTDYVNAHWKDEPFT